MSSILSQLLTDSHKFFIYSLYPSAVNNSRKYSPRLKPRSLLDNSFRLFTIEIKCEQSETDRNYETIDESNDRFRTHFIQTLCERSRIVDDLIR